MQSKEELKKKICQAVDRKRGDIISIGEDIMRNPELGFKEFRTAKLVSGTFDSLGIPHRDGLAITGVKGILEGKKPGPTVALIGELDSLIVPDHPISDKETGAAHACGHNAQIAGLMGAAMAMRDAKAADSLSGNVVFFAVPAEECVEVGYRASLIDEGKLAFLCGKPELVRLGEFDDIDMAMMIHTNSNPEDKFATVVDSFNGAIVKLVRFTGRAAHAGAAPHQGINALYAANVALSAINAQRETFKDEDTVRVHPIVTRGGDVVSIIPSDVRIETYVRGKTNEAISDADRKVDRALRAGAMALGAKVEIRTLGGFMPFVNDQSIKDIFVDNAASLFGEDEVTESGHRTGSTDMGDISHIMPALHPFIAGAQGPFHSAGWHIADHDLGYLAPAKSLAMAAVDLLWGNAENAKEILDKAKPSITKEQYLSCQEDISRVELYDGVANESRME